MTIKTTVIVEGPGTIINYEMFIIEQALRAAGLTVIVVNDYPEDNELETLSHTHQFVSDFPDVKEVTLVAKHYPWGG
jgi:DNA-binding Lrp family transcriptional regulator